MKIILKLTTIISLIVISSCATQTFVVNPKVKREVPAGNPHFSKSSHFFISGIGQSMVLNASEFCKESDGVAFVESKQSFAQVFLTGITYGIYTPRTMNVYCNK